MIGKVDPSSSDDFSVDSILDIVLDLPVGILDVELVVVGLVAVCFVDVELGAVDLETSTANETYPKFVFFTLKKIKGFYTLIKKPSTSEKNLGFHPK